MEKDWLLVAIVVLVVLLVLVVFFIRRRRNEDRYDGQLTIIGYDEDTGIPHLELTIKTDPKMLAQKSTIRLRSVDQTK